MGIDHYLKHAGMKLKGKVVLFIVTVVPCLPLLCIAIVLFQDRTPDYHHHAAPRQDGWEVIPKQFFIKENNEVVHKGSCPLS